ncbi:MAG TPA: methionine ABC transporter ATP-binding protein [Ruminococcaceae bacterium]|nr:methionine ABC transporter ATP-binding protein [Oscillospiraceae bacterium]HCM24795.1 methionine ABC transporter ATP-binding protein [Oscillospiraceae bacterium]
MIKLEFKNVSYRHDNREVLHNLSVQFAAGDYVSIVGSSGSGKSTFLRLCCHLISPSEGNIFLNGQDMLLQNPIELRKKVSYCFQEPILWGTTVEDNVTFPYQIRNQKLDISKVTSLLSDFHMTPDYLHHEIQNLSGGEKQRIALIRTMLFEPEILLLDEVTSALDAENTELVEKAILNLNQQGITILWVTHNDEQSRKYANKLLTIEDGQIQSLEVIK